MTGVHAAAFKSLSGSTTQFPGRYSSLDIWRGVASFLVVIHHLLSNRPGLISDFFYLFVQVFFVISGYCLSAALHRATDTGMGFGTFMKRRVRRIAPPYLASVAVVQMPAGADAEHGMALAKAAFRVLRPYGGTAVFAGLDANAAHDKIAAQQRFGLAVHPHLPSRIELVVEQEHRWGVGFGVEHNVAQHRAH